jgi:hypothetical protein
MFLNFSISDRSGIQRSPKDFLKVFPDTLLFFVDGTVLNSSVGYDTYQQRPLEFKSQNHLYRLYYPHYPDENCFYFRALSRKDPRQESLVSEWNQPATGQNLRILDEDTRKQENVPILAIGGDKGMTSSSCLSYESSTSQNRQSNPRRRRILEIALPNQHCSTQQQWLIFLYLTDWQSLSGDARQPPQVWPSSEAW